MKKITKAVTTDQIFFVCDECASEHHSQMGASECEKSHVQNKCEHVLRYNAYGEEGSTAIGVTAACQKCGLYENRRLGGWQIDQTLSKQLFELGTKE